MALQIRRLSYALGAQVIGVDFGKPLDDKTFAEINNAFLEHSVLVFRGQSITREQHVAFSRRFGELDIKTGETKAVDKKVPGFPELLVVMNKPTPSGEAPTGHYSGRMWHSDHSYVPASAKCSLLRSVELPGLGGDTMFCNMYLAYESLSDGMKKLLEGLYGVHSDGKIVIDESTLERAAQTSKRYAAAAHPVVKVHPETGRKALFMSEQCKLIVGMTPEESKPLIQYLTNHATRPQNVYRHKWQKDDLVIWDNRCLLHIALADFDRTKVRHMERVTVKGAVSGCAYEGALE